MKFLALNLSTASTGTSERSSIKSEVIDKYVELTDIANAAFDFISSISEDDNAISNNSLLTSDGVPPLNGNDSEVFPSLS